MQKANDPMKTADPILITPHFGDFIDTPHLFNERDRLPGPDGTPGLGLKLREAVPLAEHWWETTARFSMPDFGKDPHSQVIKSGVLMGLPWLNLTKAEMLNVLAQWYAHVGIHTIVEAKSTSRDGDAARVQDAKAKTGKVFAALGKAAHAVHSPTSDKAEVAEWAGGYEEIKNDGKIIGTDGNFLTAERQSHGKEIRENRSKATAQG